jgi:hypothetical protein
VEMQGCGKLVVLGGRTSSFIVVLLGGRRGGGHAEVLGMVEGITAKRVAPDKQPAATWVGMGGE